MIKALALDIDGTITYQNRQLDIRALKAVEKAKKKRDIYLLSDGEYSLLR